MNHLTIEEFYAGALKKLAVSDYSCGEMLDWLEKRGCAAGDAQAVVGWLLERNYINDERLCARLCEGWLQSGLCGKKALKAKLIKRKLPAQLIEAQLLAMDADEVEKAKKVLAAYLRKIKKNDETTWTKAMRHLAARGFAYDAAMRALTDSKNK